MSFPTIASSIAPAIARFFGKNNHEDVPHRIYGTVVAQARNSALYTDFAIQDTVMGRYDMLALHVFLLNNRLKQARTGGQSRCSALSQDVFDLFITDLERGLRDIGFADTSVHKRKKRLVRSYYALIDEFDEALGKADVDRLAQAISKRYFDKMKEPVRNAAAIKLANYMLSVVQCLSSQSNQTVMQGKINWPPIVKVQYD